MIVVLAKTSTPQYSWDSTTCQAVRFLAEIESQLQLKLESGKVGRPRKENKLDPTPITDPSNSFDDLIVTSNLKSGIYIVTLNNDQPISVNANDPRIADKVIKVTKKNCKIGKAKDLADRRKNYFKVFGERNVNFRPVVKMLEIDAAEKAILAHLDQYRIRGITGRKNEWLQDIESSELLRIVLNALSELGLPFEQVEW